MGVLSTEVAPQQVLVMEQEIKALLEKVAIEYVPHSNRETGFYSQYFIVPKKDGGMRPILDLRVLNESIFALPVGLLHMRPLQWWLRTKGFSQRGNPFRIMKVMRRCLRALIMWKKPWLLSQGPMLGASRCRKTLSTDASLTDWGAILEGRSSQGLWKDHHLSWHINRLEMLTVFLALKNFLADVRGHHVLVRSDDTSVVSYINHQGGLRSHPLCKLACQILLWSQGKLLSLRETYWDPWDPQNRSRHPVETGAEARGMEAPPRGGGADMEGVWPGTSGSVCVSRDVSQPTLVLPHASSSSWTGCDDTDVAEASSVCISPDRSAPRTIGESSPGPGPTTSYCPAVAGQSMVPKSIIPSRRASSGAPRQEGPSVPIS